MVRDQDDQDDERMQHRDQRPRHEQPGRAHGRLPHEGEIVGDKAPPFEVTGMDALSPPRMRVGFPAMKENVIDAIGSARIAVDESRTASVREVIEKTSPDGFRPSTEVEHAVQRIWQQVMPHPACRSPRWQGDDLDGRSPH